MPGHRQDHQQHYRNQGVTQVPLDTLTGQNRWESGAPADQRNTPRGDTALEQFSTVGDSAPQGRFGDI